MKMDDDTEIKSLPLSCLPPKTRELLSCLLDTPKVILSDGPDKLPRDWRGLAYLVHISSEKAEYIQLRPQKTAALLEIWQQDRTATVGQLLSHLERLDRYDVYDDLWLDLKKSIQNGQIVVNRQNQIAIHNNNNNNNNNSNGFLDVNNVITYDDRPGHEQQYDAFVLYAKEDRHFAEELIQRMTAANFQLCTEDSLHVGHSTPYAPIAQLIWERCPRLIMVCSPAFLNSPTNTFYRDYAQAVSIESRNHKILPIIYRECQLPSHLAFYHKLRYNEDDERDINFFWQKLTQSLELARYQRQQYLITNSTTRAVQPKVELPSSTSTLPGYSDDHLFLTPSQRSNSLYGLDSLRVPTHLPDCNSLSSLSQNSGKSDAKKKKKAKSVQDTFSRLWNTFKLKKSNNKKAMMFAH